MERVKQIGLTLGLMIVLTAVLMAIVGCILWKCHCGDREIGIGVVVIDIVVNVFGGFCLGKMIGKQKLIWGFLIGIVYFLLLALVGVSFFDTKVQGNSLMMSGFFVCSISAMLGGMLAPEKRNVTKN